MLLANSIRRSPSTTFRRSAWARPATSAACTIWGGTAEQPSTATSASSESHFSLLYRRMCSPANPRTIALAQRLVLRLRRYGLLPRPGEPVRHRDEQRRVRHQMRWLPAELRAELHHFEQRAGVRQREPLLAGRGLRGADLRRQLRLGRLCRQQRRRPDRPGIGDIRLQLHPQHRLLAAGPAARRRLLRALVVLLTEPLLEHRRSQRVVSRRRFPVPRVLWAAEPDQSGRRDVRWAAHGRGPGSAQPRQDGVGQPGRRVVLRRPRDPAEAAHGVVQPGATGQPDLHHDAGAAR